MASYSEFWATGGKGDPALVYALQGKSPNRYHLARHFKRGGLAKLAEVIHTIAADATPASTASITKVQVAGEALPGQISNGGVRTIETVEQMDVLNANISSSSANTARAIAAGDVTDLDRLLIGGAESLRRPSTYPTDLSGNGGGGKLNV